MLGGRPGGKALCLRLQGSWGLKRALDGACGRSGRRVGHGGSAGRRAPPQRCGLPTNPPRFLPASLNNHSPSPQLPTPLWPSPGVQTASFAEPATRYAGVVGSWLGGEQLVLAAREYDRVRGEHAHAAVLPGMPPCGLPLALATCACVSLHLPPSSASPSLFPCRFPLLT